MNAALKTASPRLHCTISWSRAAKKAAPQVQTRSLNAVSRRAIERALGSAPSLLPQANLDAGDKQCQTVEVGLSFVSDEEIRELNATYRGKNKPTDVLSFAQQEGELFPTEEGAEVLTLGDIVISIETAMRQATERHHSLEHEITFLCVHGLLHLRGYDHMNAKERRIMWKQQDAIMEQLTVQADGAGNSRKT